MTHPQFDVFEKDKLGIPIWVEAASDLETARTRLRELSKGGTKVFVFNHKTQQIVTS
jgi:c-di-GMP-binding flagellar brake protein YcgR